MGVMSGVKTLFRRFPVTTVLVIIEFIGLSILTENKFFHEYVNMNYSYLFGLSMLANVSLIFGTITVQLSSERFGFYGWKKYGLHALFIAVVALIAYLLITPDFESFKLLSGSFTGNTYRLLILVFLSGLSMFTVPFLKDGSSKEWWNFFITSVFRASVSVLYSVALYIGLALALFAIDAFWKFTFFDNQYALVSIFSFVLVAPLHFLHDVYAFSMESVVIEIPKYLSILVKYILTPLIGIYTIILYPYIFSFPFRDTWPANESTGIILALHAMIYAGIVLFYGVKEGSEDEKFKRLFTKITAVISIPTVIFWLYSLYLRIDAYGVTVNRFVLMVLILWFLGTSLYLLLSKGTTNIKYILSGLFILVAGAFYLPFSSFYWGEKAQLARLVDIAKSEGLYKEGLIERGVKPKVSGNDYTMGEITYYINMYSKSKTLEKYLGSSVKEHFEINKYGYASVKGVVGVDREYGSPDSFSALYYSEPTNVQPNQESYATIRLDIENVPIPEGYKTTRYLYINYSDLGENTFKVDGYTFEINIDPKADFLYGAAKTENELETELGPKTQAVIPNTSFVDDVSKVTFTDGEAVFIVEEFSGRYENDKFTKLDSVMGYLFLK